MSLWLCAGLLSITPVGAVDADGIAACDVESSTTVLQEDRLPAGLAAQAIWLDQRHLQWPQHDDNIAGGRFVLAHSADARLAIAADGSVTGADGRVELEVVSRPLPPTLRDRFPHLDGGVVLAIPETARATLPELLRQQLLVLALDSDQRPLAVTRVQIAGALDALYADAVGESALGAQPAMSSTRLALWAPSARRVSLCLYRDGTGAAISRQPLIRNDHSGIWQVELPGNLEGDYYTYLVEVIAPGTGRVINRVTDPYSLGLTTESRRSRITDLDNAALKPSGWDRRQRPEPAEAAVDQVIYELHVRDFSVADDSVRRGYRGRYLAFTEPRSRGMRHLRSLVAAGVTDVHLLPVFDFASVPEADCLPSLFEGAADGTGQQAQVAAIRHRDCHNWGYDPYHFTTPEGSYAGDAADGTVRIREFRAMVMALNAIGLRVGMDVVYNHTFAAGQDDRSVLDRIVPGYYHRLDADGHVETSTCCPNTATEHAMMARLMIDSAVVWVRDYGIDAFRFDLMGHQPRAAMERLQTAVNAAAGRPIRLLGEGWNFGEVADGARFVQASQRSLPGSGIATFSDRARDAVRGGGCCDSGATLVAGQGWLNGLNYAPNALATSGGEDRQALLRQADLARVGLAGTLRDYRMRRHDGMASSLSAIDYAGQPAGYAAEPGEVVNYVENHDNLTLFDLNVLKLPQDTSADDRARVQVLGNAIVAFSQGIAYLHAGQEILRSKSLDRNSYDSGDGFNRLDWRLRDNGFGRGLPPAWDNQSSWRWMQPLLADTTLRPTPAQIRWTRDAVFDLLRIRNGSSLFRLRSAEEVQQRLRFFNTGPDQEPTVLVGHLDGEGLAGAGFAALVYLINADSQAHALTVPELAGQTWRLHPIQASRRAADQRPRRDARYDHDSGRFTIPARTAVVFVRP